MRLVHWAVGLAILGAGASLPAQAGPTSGSTTAKSIRATSQDRASLRAWDATIDGLTTTLPSTRSRIPCTGSMFPGFLLPQPITSSTRSGAMVVDPVAGA